MVHPFYSTQPDARGEYDEYFVDHAGAYVRRERISTSTAVRRDRGSAGFA